MNTDLYKQCRWEREPVRRSTDYSQSSINSHQQMEHEPTLLDIHHNRLQNKYQLITIIDSHSGNSAC